MKTQFALKPTVGLGLNDDSLGKLDVSNSTFYIYKNNETYRIFDSGESAERIKFTNSPRLGISALVSPPTVTVEVSNVYASSFCAIFTTTGAETYSLLLDSLIAVPVTGLHGNVVTCVVWKNVGESNFEFICGCQNGKVFSVVFENKREKSCRLIAEFSGTRIVAIAINQGFVYVSTPTCLYSVSSQSTLLSESPTSLLTNSFSTDHPDGNIFWLNSVGIVAIHDSTWASLIVPHSLVQQISPSSIISKPIKEVENRILKPIYFKTSNFHFIIVYEGGKICLVSKIAPGPAISTINNSKIIGLVQDSGTRTMYAYSQKRVFEIVLTNEASDAWIHYMKKHNFAKALGAANSSAERGFILCAEADFVYTTTKQLNVCAELYGKALVEDQSAVDLIDVIVKLGPDKPSLLAFLIHKLDLAGIGCTATATTLTVQVNVLFIYCCELFIELILQQDGNGHRETFLKFVKDKYSQLDIECIRTVYDLLESVGLFDELVSIAELVGDMATAIRMDLQRGNFSAILDRLHAQQNYEQEKSIIDDTSPILFRFCPSSFVALLKKRNYHPDEFLSVLAGASCLTAEHRVAAIAFLKYSLIERQLSVTSQTCNTLVQLVALTKDDPETSLITLIEAIYQQVYFDYEFTMRRIIEEKFIRAEIVLLSLFDAFLDSVSKALEMGYVDLAKTCAWKSHNRNTRRKCWLLILQHQHAANGDEKVLLDLYHECKSVVDLDDLLLLCPEGVPPEEVCDLVLTLQKGQEELTAEINGYEEALKLIRNDLNSDPNTCIILLQSQKCHLCFELVYTENFVAFNCSHCFHTQCLAGAMIGNTTSCCCLCSESSLLLKQMFEPFVDPAIDNSDEWAIQTP